MLSRFSTARSVQNEQPSTLTNPVPATHEVLDRTVLDALPTPIMLCHPQTLIIYYVNEASKQALAGLSHLLPVPVSKMVGQNIDIFHKHPEHQRQLLANPDNLPHQAIVKLGDSSLDLTVNAVGADPKNPTALMLTWTNATQRLASEEKANRLIATINEMPINAMLCDPETLKITYANKASFNTLKKIEHLLPVKADKLVGQSIDIFHKHPEHQRKMLANPANFPHRAQIKLGDEHLELYIASIPDRKGNPITFLLTWSIISERVGMASTLTSAVDVVSQSAATLIDNAGSLTEASGKTAQEAAALGSAADQTSDMARTVAAATEELAASTQEITRRTKESARLVEQVVDAVGGASGTMTSLESTATRIGEVVDLIKAIASQTNLLALNATIEAARAGEAGRGFAVVANEVKSLATQTASATGDIIAQVEAIQSATAAAAKALSDIRSLVNKVESEASGIAVSASEQGMATKEIAVNVQATASAADQMSHAIRQIIDLASSSQTGASDVRIAANELSGWSKNFEQDVKRLINTH
jgi:methyl-accepting chemotaxis protein